MKLLLDTHIWIWSLESPHKLSRRVSSALGRSTNELWLSPLSYWEFLYLSQKGRFGSNIRPLAWIEAARKHVPLRDAPLTTDVSLAAYEIALAHGDPIDTLLAATARAYDLTLVTADNKLIAGKGFAVLANF